MRWGGTLSPNQWACSNPIGDRGTPLIITGSTYGLRTEMLKFDATMIRSSKPSNFILLSRGFEPLQSHFLMFVYHTFFYMRSTDTIVKHYFGIKYLGYHTTESLLAQFGLRSRYRTKKVVNFRVFILKIINFKYITKIVIFVESFFEQI